MKLKLLSCILTLCFFGMLSAQNYPVTVVPQAVSPSPIYFSSYADAGTINSPLRVQILLNDITLSNVEVRLKTYFEGNGIRFESNNAVVGANPIYLEGGVPVNLTNIQLAPFYSLQNISGINSNQYAQPIPEGSYQFCFEVYDAFTGNRLSARSCATTYIFKNEPPFLVLPRRDETIDVRNPQNIVFQWTPRHINVSNVEYEFSIVEIWDHYVDPQAAFFSMPPIFQANTRNTSYLLGPADPMLLPNKKYAWRVQAKAISGTEEIGLFNNNGYSEIFWFNHSQPCEVPANVRHEVKGTHQANIEWDDFSTEIPEYKVRYREKNSSPSGGGREGEGAWFYSRSNTNWTTIWDLRPGTIYEYQVNRKCQLIESEYSPVKTFTTFLADDESGLYNCGITPEINITNTDRLPDLFVNDVFKAGDFPIKVLEVSGSNGRFTGKGYATIPYLKSVRVAVNFTNVLINTDNQLTEGTVVTKYDPSMANILDIDQAVDIVEDFGDIINGGDTHTLEVDFAVAGANSIVVGEDTITITGTNGETKVIDRDEEDTYTITTQNAVYEVDTNGNVTEMGAVAEGGPANAENTEGISPSGGGTAQSASVSEVYTEGVMVHFRKGKGTVYELDMVDNEYERRTYPKAKTSDGKDYYPVHKAVVNNTTEVFYADITITNPEIKIDSLIFKTVTSGLEIKTDREGEKTFKITIEGKNAYRNEEAIITYKDETGKQQVIASFFIHHLHKLQTRKVQIVTVNGAPPIEGLKETLNDVFGVAGASFDVNSDIHEINIGPSIWNSDVDNGMLDYNGSGLLPDYPKEIRAIHQYYMANTANYDSKAYYLFLVDQDIKVSKPINGFMPKGRQFGYIFNAYKNQGLGAKDEQDKVAAHELGHGVFSLEHPFESDSNAGKTEWLMDYKKDGIQLPFTHWAVMSDTGLNLQLFQPDEGGEHYTTKGFFKNLNFSKNRNNTFTFITPSGQYLILPENVEDVTKFFGYYGFSEILNENFNQFISIVPGTIREFKIEDKVFTAVIEKQGDDFVLRGYYNKETEYKPEDYNINISDSYENKGIIFAFGLEENTYGYTAYSLNTDELSVFEGNGNIKDILSFPVQYRGSSIEKKTIPFEPGNKQFSMSPENLQWVFNSEYFNNSDGTLFIRNKIAEFRALYPELVNQITARYSKWSENNICNYNSLFNSFENHLKAEFCIAHSVEQPLISNPTIVTTTLVYELNSQKTLPSTQLEWQQLYYQYIKDNALKTSEQIGISLSEFNTVSLIPEFSCIDITTIINSASQNDIMLLSTEAILHLVSHYMLHGCTSEGYTLYNDFESAIVKLIKNSNPAIAKEIILGLESKNKYDDSEYLYEQLFWALDDDYLFGLSSNNRNKLISACTDLMFRNTDFYSERLDDAIDKIENRVFIFEYNNILKNSAKTIIDAFSYINISGLLTKEAVHKDWQYYDISYVFNKDGTIKLAQTKDFGWLDSENVFEDHFKPFDLVIFVNKSNVSLVKEYLKANEDLTQYPIPAIALSYASQAGSNQTSSDAIYASLDVIGAIGSGGTLATVKGLTKLRKILLVSDLLSSGTGLASTAISDNEQLADIKNSLDDVSRILGIAGMAENFVPSGSSPRQILKKVKDNIGDNTEIPTNQQIENVFNTIENASYEKLKILSTEASDDAKTIELLLVKRIKDAADANNTADFNKANKVLKKLKDARNIVSNTGKIVVGEKNILPVESIAGEFKSFTYKVENGAETITHQKRAGTFWNSVPAESVQYLSLDGKYYVKVVPTDGDGRLLFFDVNSNKCIGWGILPKEGGKLLNKLESAEDYESLIKDLKFIHGIENTTSVIDFADKGTLMRSLGKVNAYLGSYNPQRALGDVSKELGTQDVLNKFAIYKNYAFADNAKDMAPGSILMLNIPDEMYNPSTFFDDFNKEFLDYLIKNKEKMEIVFTTKPEYQDLFKVWENGDYIENDMTGLFEPSGFAKEIKYLRDRGIKIVKFKDGTIINLDDVDLSEMDWITNWKH